MQFQGVYEHPEALMKKKKNFGSWYNSVKLISSLEDMWVVLDSKVLIDLEFDRLWFCLLREDVPCFRRHSKILPSARLLSFCIGPQRVIQFQTKPMTEWQQGLDSRAAMRGAA